jgi:hypothetical protein
MNFPSARLVQVPFRMATLDQSVDQKQVPIGVLDALENGVWVKSGRIEKRPGTERLSDEILSGSLSTMSSELKKAWSRDKELAVTDGDAIYSWLPSSEKWKRVHSIRAVEATWKTAVDSMTTVNHFDLDASDDVIAMCWVGGGGIALRVIDADGGDVFLSSNIYPTGNRPRVLVKGDLVVLVFQSGTSIAATTLDITTGVLSPGLTVMVSDADSSLDFSWDASHNGNDVTVAYRTTGGEIGLFTFDTSLGLLTQDVIPAPVAPAIYRRVALHATAGENLWVAFESRTGTISSIRLARRNLTTLAAVGAIISVATLASLRPVTHIAVTRFTSTRCIVAYSDHFTTEDACTYTCHVSTAAVVGPTQRTCWAHLNSKPFALGGRFYAMLLSTRPSLQVAGVDAFSQNTSFLVEIEDSLTPTANAPHKLAAVIAPREGPAIDDISSIATPCGVAVVGNTARMVTRCARAQAVSTIAGADRNGAYLVEVTTELSHPWNAVQVGRTLAIAGGALSTYDGRQFYEAGFLHPPRIIELIASAGGTMDVGDYLYTFVYEWRDLAGGLLYRSAPSQPVKVTLAGGDLSVAGSIEAACTTGKADQELGFGTSLTHTCRIIPYRTAAGGTTFYRLIDELLNDPIVGTVAFSDARPDGDLSTVGSGPPLTTRPLLYTTGGFLDEVIPPSFTTCILHRGRIFGVAGDLRTIWASKVYTENALVFPGFHENLRIVIDEDITGLASLDDKLVIFTASSIYIVVGDGPTAGGQGAFAVPEVVQSDAGAVSARGIVEVPDGVMFQSKRGIYLLTRQLELVWVGKQVRDEVESYPVVFDARLVPHRNQVRFSVFNPDFDEEEDESEGAQLVFDYVNGFWSVFRYYNNADEVEGARVNSSVVHQDVLHLTNGPNILRESDETNRDHSSHWVQLAWELTIIAEGPIAWQHVRRVQILGERRTHHDLTVSFAFNHAEAYAQSYRFTAVQVLVNNDSPSIRVGSQNGANPKCKAIRIRASDASPTPAETYTPGVGTGGWFSGIGLEIIPKPGLPRHGANASKV